MIFFADFSASNPKNWFNELFALYVYNVDMFELFHCHCLRSSSCCKMADWCVCLFTDMPLRLVSSAMSSPPLSDGSVSPHKTYSFHTICLCRYDAQNPYLSFCMVPVRRLKPWSHLSYTEETSHPGSVFHFDSIGFLSSFSWFFL